jgi:hypothetical protein
MLSLCQAIFGALALIVRIQAGPLKGDDRGLEKRSITFNVNQARANAVKEAFSFGWSGYYKYAFPHDQLNPQTNSFSDPRQVDAIQRI